MDLIELNYNDEVLNQEQGLNENTSVDHLLSVDSPEENPIDEDPIVSPRLGEIYQAEIPPLLTESERRQLASVQDSVDDVFGGDHSIRLGLTIPLMWPDCTGDQVKHEQRGIPGIGISANLPGSVDQANWKESSMGLSNKVTGFPIDYSSSHGVFSQETGFKYEHSGDSLGCHMELIGCMIKEKRTIDGLMDVDVRLQQPGEPTYFNPLPGTPSISWSPAESQSFTLGLYIFGKNLGQIKKFMGTKGMGDILAFYYGKFYRSDAHRRWTECKKMRSRRSIHGTRIFTGWRQQELLSRLLLGTSNGTQDSLLEAIKAFNEGRAALEELVLSLKGIVGMDLLVEAVGIGQGKRDLTGIVFDPIRTNQVISVRSDIPIGKACSSLATGDIIKFLTGNFRLSKARSNDLFWEAVWPRLLARGWHSEQPKDLPSVGSRNALVFLIPGVKKFSRRKLIKGNHYFDSVSDVLNKVASDPTLMELEVEGSKGGCSIKDKQGCDIDSQLKPNSLPGHQRSCYLRPRVPNCNSEVMKFTIVDTSLDEGEAPKKIRELRSLPVDATYDHSMPLCSGETDTDSLSGQSDSADMSLSDPEESNPGKSESEKTESNRIPILGYGVLPSAASDYLSAVPKQRTPANGYDTSTHLHDLLNKKQPFNDIRSPSSWTHDYLAPVVKRRRLTACKHAGSKRNAYSFPQGYQMKKEEIDFESKPLKLTESMGEGEAGSSRSNFYSLPRDTHFKKEDTHYEIKPLKRSESTTAEAESSRRKLHHSSAEESREYLFSGTCFSNAAPVDGVLYHGKFQPQTMIDLNIPYLPPEIKTEEHFCMDVAGSQDDLNPGTSSFTLDTNLQFEGPLASDTSDGFPALQHSTTSGRRQSTRNRPLTTKALEAFACGYLTTNRRGRGAKVLPSRSSRRARRPVRTPSPASTNLDFSNPAGLVSNVGINEEFSTYTNHTGTFHGSHDQSERKASHDSLGVP